MLGGRNEVVFESLQRWYMRPLEHGPLRRLHNTREKVENYLVGEFSDHPEEKVLEAFAWAFFDGDYQVHQTKKQWSGPVREMERIANRLERGEAIDRLPPRLERFAQETPDETASALRLRAELERIYHRGSPKTGGKEPADHALGIWVKMGFEDLGASIGIGISGTDPKEPSTRFGRVVRAALSWRKSSANWRRVAEAAAKSDF